jgi:hypothetical protein
MLLIGSVVGLSDVAAVHARLRIEVLLGAALHCGSLDLVVV